MNNQQMPMPKTAFAELKGGPLAPNIKGEVYIQEVEGGVMVSVYVIGLPTFKPGNPPIGPFGFHMHEKGTCEVGDQNEPFMAAGEHYNPDKQPHGNHAGDFPVLFSNNGVAYMIFFTNRFTVNESVLKSIIIHQNPDDYRTEPAGNSGKRLACGVVNLLP